MSKERIERFIMLSRIIQNCFLRKPATSLRLCQWGLAGPDAQSVDSAENAALADDAVDQAAFAGQIHQAQPDEEGQQTLARQHQHNKARQRQCGAHQVFKDQIGPVPYMGSGLFIYCFGEVVFRQLSMSAQGRVVVKAFKDLLDSFFGESSFRRTPESRKTNRSGTGGRAEC